MHRILRTDCLATACAACVACRQNKRLFVYARLCLLLCALACYGGLAVVVATGCGRGKERVHSTGNVGLLDDLGKPSATSSQYQLWNAFTGSTVQQVKSLHYKAQVAAGGGLTFGNSSSAAYTLTPPVTVHPRKGQ